MNMELFTLMKRQRWIYLSWSSRDFRGMGWKENLAHACYWQKYPANLQQTLVFHTGWFAGALQIWVWYENLIKWLISFPSSHIHTSFLLCQVSSGGSFPWCIYASEWKHPKVTMKRTDHTKQSFWELLYSEFSLFLHKYDLKRCQTQSCYAFVCRMSSLLTRTSCLWSRLRFRTTCVLVVTT